jgi:hypothetical protein
VIILSADKRSLPTANKGRRRIRRGLTIPEAFLLRADAVLEQAARIRRSPGVSNGLDQRKWKFCGEESLIQNKGNGGTKTMIVLDAGLWLLGRGDQIRALKDSAPTPA